MLLILGALGAYVSLRDFNAYRGWAEAWLGTELGVAVAISGDLELGLGWDSVVVVNAVTLGRNDKSKAALARIERLEAKIALIPFVTSFRRELIVEGVTVQGVQLWLGRPSFDAASQAPPVARADVISEIPRMSMRLRAVEATNITLRYATDSETGKLQIDRASAIAAGDVMRIAATGAVAGYAIRIDGSIGTFEQFLARSTQPVAVDLLVKLAEKAQLRLHGNVIGDGIDLTLDGEVREVGSVRAISTAQPLLLSARVQAATPAEAWRLTDVNVKFGTLAVTGVGAVRAGEVPDLQLTLHAAALDLAALEFGAVSPEKREVPISAGLGLGLDRFTAEIELSTAAATLPEGVRLTDLHGRVTVKDGKAALTAFGAVLASGAVAATGELNARGEFTAKLTARGVDLGELIRETRGRSTVSGGATVLQADLHGRISGGKSIMASLGGRADLSVGRARVSNAFSDRLGLLQIFNIIDRALPLGPSIAVNCAAGRFTIEDGVARTRGLMIDLPRVALWVAGRIDLDTEAINLRVEPQPKVAALVSVVPPANIRGTLSQPVVEPDVIGTAVGVASGLLSAPGLLVGEIGDVVTGLGALVTGSSAIGPRVADTCQAPSQSSRDTRPGLRIPNLFDLFR